MRKRLRKKLHRGEFTEYGFDVTATLVPHVNAPVNDAGIEAWYGYHDEYIAKWDEFEDFLHTRGLCSGGAVGAYWSLFITKTEGPRPRTVTPLDLHAVVDWLYTHGAIVLSYDVGPMRDAWR